MRGGGGGKSQLSCHFVIKYKTCYDFGGHLESPLKDKENFWGPLVCYSGHIS